MALEFKNAHIYDASYGYAVTNEEPETHIELLGGRHFKRGGCIASGGEIVLFVMLTHCDEVIAVDHSISSLTTTALKVEALRHYGPEKTKEVLSGATNANLNTFFDKVKSKVPEGINRRPSYWDAYGIQREWQKVPLAIVEDAYKRLDNLKLLIHGDFTDLPGRFDLLYASNICEHSNRNKKSPSLDEFEPLSTEDGAILHTVYNGTVNSRYPSPLWQKMLASKHWKQTQFKGGPRSQWQHCLWERVPVTEGALVTI